MSLPRWLHPSLVTLVAACGADGRAQSAGDVQVPDGFVVELFAADVPKVRTLKFGPDGMLYAVQSDEGLIVRLDPGAAAPAPVVVADDLSRPYGLAFHDGALYVGEHHQVIRLDGPDF